MTTTPAKKPAVATAKTTSSSATASAAAAAAAAKKSGIKSYKPGEIIFNEKDAADSLFIIQRGQIRLYVPKGRGFVEIGILRSGEVIGEMGYFDEKSRRRSCSAQAIVTTEVVEISYNAFAKTMEGLNPWFKTIINTLAERLRKTNDKVRALESNSVGFAKDGKVADYKFFVNADVVKILATIYLALKAHGEIKSGKIYMHEDRLKLYMMEINNVKEIVYEEFKIMLVEQKLLALEKDESGMAKMMVFENIETYRSLMTFFNTQRQLEDSKQVKISSKCEKFLKKILDQMDTNPPKEGVGSANLTVILADFKAKNIPVSEEDLVDSANSGFTGDIIVGDDNIISTTVQYMKLKKSIVSIQIMNAIKKVNDTKAGHA